MKGYCFIIIATVTAATAQAAYFEHYSGGFRSTGTAYAKYGTSLIDGPYSDSQDDKSYSTVEQYAEVYSGNTTYAYGYIANSAWDINDIENNSVAIRFNSYNDVVSYMSNSAGYAYGAASTEDEITYGKFYNILPSAGEQIGDGLTVLCATTIKVTASGTTYAYIGGPGNMTHIAITRGQLPPVPVEPATVFEVWTMENIMLENESIDGFTRIDSFDAKIGDVIGVFAENYTDIDVTGIDDGLIESDLTIILTAETILPGDIDRDGDVDLADFAELANNWLAGT